MRKKKQAAPAAQVPAAFKRCAERLYDVAETVKDPDARAGLLHLGDLYQHCPSFYPNVNIRESDGLPLRTSYASASGVGSPGAMCVEA